MAVKANVKVTADRFYHCFGITNREQSFGSNGRGKFEQITPMQLKIHKFSDWARVVSTEIMRIDLVSVTSE